MRQLKFSEIMDAVTNTNNAGKTLKVFEVFYKGEKEICTDCDGNEVILFLYKDKYYLAGWDAAGIANFERRLKEQTKGVVQ